MSDDHKWTDGEIEAFTVVQGELPHNCTCGKDQEPLAVFHAPGCKYRKWYVATDRQVADACHYGIGYARLDSDGKLTHIPYQDTQVREKDKDQ